MRSSLSHAALTVALFTGVLHPARGQDFEVLHHFAGDVADGPAGPVVQGSDGNLYGTTNSGPGASANGTFFKREPGQAPVTLHDFAADDGSSPQMIVEGEDGNFYGVALFGGEFGFGTAFRVTPEGDLTVLHHFAGPPDGALPVSLILGSDGDFYGVGSQGGLEEEPCDFTIPGCGTLFRMTPGGAVTTLHTFSYDDGLYPNGLVQATDGNFYGTTAHGGTGCECGTVFRLTPGGSFTKLHDFDSVDGSAPLGTLIQASDGKLYGTVAGGLIEGRGGVFRMTLQGDVSLVHAFDGDDAWLPAAGVTQAADGMLYGTTNAGGASESGTVYRVDPAGTNFQVVHTFDGTDGENPFTASLLEANDGDLYGATFSGGDNDAGVLYRLHFAPPAPLFCPNSFVRRDQMAVFLLKVMNGPTFTPPACQGDFGDVACPSLFADWIEALADAGVTAGCGGGNFCPLSAIRRDQMAVFLLKAAHGSAFTPPACEGDFPDVACPSPFADWIEALADEGITAGCGAGFFCPDAAVTRAQMSVFLLKIEHGTSYAPPVCQAVFADVACPSAFADWIEQFYAEGITAGCAGGTP